MFAFLRQELRELGDAVGVVSRGASSSVIDALPLARFIAAENNSAAAPSKPYPRLLIHQSVLAKLF